MEHIVAYFHEHKVNLLGALEGEMTPAEINTLAKKHLDEGTKVDFSKNKSDTIS